MRNQSDEIKRPFAEVLQYYAMERFLYRLSKTRYADKFILKGGLLFYVWNLPLRRSTRDIDFRGYVSGNRSTLLKIIHEVISVSAPEDGLAFDSQSILVDETQIDVAYQGIRVKLSVLLERTRVSLQIDIGFSDEITLKAETIEYPNILPDQKTVRVKGYPKETVVAEKFHTMIRHAELNSRFKDYYDLWLISETFEFEGQSLQKAIEATFKKRNTELSAEKPIGLTNEFATTNQTRWNNFLKKMNLETEESMDFANVVEHIWRFLKHPLDASVKKEKSNLNWSPRKKWK